MTLIIDVSSNNGPVNWKAASSQIAGVYVKATEGRSYVSRSMHYQVKGAREAKLHVGYYHFARPDQNTPFSEAQHFVGNIGKVGLTDLKPALDYEHPCSLSSSEQQEWIRHFNEYVHEKLGVWPIFYSYSAFVANLHLKPPVGNGLWLANYGRNDGSRGPVPVPPPWRKVHLHQFTSNGHIPGYSGGMDISYCKTLTPILAYPVRGRLMRPLL